MRNMAKLLCTHDVIKPMNNGGMYAYAYMQFAIDPYIVCAATESVIHV